jgi:hypothetical protein
MNEIISDADQVEYIIKYLKDGRDIKMVDELQRTYTK